MATTDLDAAMQSKKVSPQWRKMEELHSQGWKYQHLDGSGKRILIERDGEQRRIQPDGSVTK